MSLPSDRVTLRDIAQAAGCHFTTVSLALRNRPGIPAATRERIRRIAKQLGYRPDPLLAALSSYRRAKAGPGYRATLGWVTNFPTRKGWAAEEIYAEYFAGARSRAAALGFKLEEFWLGESGMSAGRASQILSARGIEGIILAPQPVAAAALELDWDRFSATAIGYSTAQPSLHMVCPNQYRCIRLAIDRLQRREYRRIGLVMLRASDERVDHNWLAGYLVGQAEMKAADRVPHLFLPRWNDAALGRWLAMHKPDAIISKCRETLPALRRLGYAVPRDLGVAYLTGVHPGRELSGVSEDPLQVGAAAVDYLAGMLRRNERGVPERPQRLLTEGVWVDGRTVRPMPVKR